MPLLHSGGCEVMGWHWLLLGPLGFDTAEKMPLQRRFRFVLSGDMCLGCDFVGSILTFDIE